MNNSERVAKHRSKIIVFMKRYLSLFFLVAIIVVVGVGTAYASRSSSSKEDKQKASEAFSKRHQEDLKNRKESNIERKNAGATHDNFDNEKTTEERRITRIITNLDIRQTAQAAEATLMASVGRPTRSAQTLSADGLETSESLKTKLQNIQNEIESASNANDLAAAVDALEKLSAPAPKQ